MWTNARSRGSRPKFGSKHYEMSIDLKDFASFLPKYVHYMEEPVSEPASVLLFYVSKLASQHVKVLISGEGGTKPSADIITIYTFFGSKR